MSRGKQIGTVVVSVLLLLLIVYVVYNAFKPEAKDSYMVTDVHTGDIQSTYETKGTVSSNNTLSYKAASGVKVLTVNVAVGDRVKTGDVLATFDTTTLKSTLKEYKTSCDKAKTAYDNSVSSSAKASQDIVSAKAQIKTLDSEIAQLEKEIAAAEGTTDVAVTTPQYSAEQLAAMAEKLKTGGFSEEEIKAIISSVQQNAGSVSSDDIQSAIENATATKKLQLSQKQSQKQLLETQISVNQAQSNDTISDLYKSVYEQKKADYENYKNIYDIMNAGWTATADGIITQVNIEAGQVFVPVAKTSSTTDLSSIMGAVSGNADVTSVLTDIIGSTQNNNSGFADGIVLENSNEFIAEFSVGKYDLLSIKVGQSVTVTSLGNVYDAEVVYVSATASESSSMDLSSLASSLTGGSSSSSNGALVKIKIKNPDEKIIIGFDVDISINTEVIKDVLIIPIDAVLTEEGQNYVFVFDSEEGAAVKSPVTVGAYSTDEYELVSGLKEGQRVVDNPKSTLTDGTKIAVKK